METNGSNNDARLYDSDSSIKRNRVGRWSVFLGSTILATGVPALISGKLTGGVVSGLPGGTALGMLLGATIGGYLFSKILHKFIITVPQVQAFVTLNPLMSFLGSTEDPNVTYGPGWHIAYPQEERSAKSNLSTEIITLTWEEEMPGKDAQLLLKGSYQFKVDITLASHFIGVDEGTIRSGAIDLIKAFIANELADKSGDEAKAGISALNDELYKEFGVGVANSQNSRVSEFEKQYGTRTIKVTISSIDFSAKVQASRDAVDEAMQVLNGVAAMYGYKPDVLKEKVLSREISLEQYNNMVDRFAAQSDNATMDIKSHKFDGLDGAAKVFGEAFALALSNKGK